MEEQAYNFIEEDEEKHWWFQGRKEILMDILSKYANEDDKILDMGCGSGYFLCQAKKYFNNLTGVEYYDYDFKFDNVIKSDIKNIPLDSLTFDVATMFDVLEHIEIEKELLLEANRLLKKNGTLILTVPANQWMFGEHDRINDHFRRYSAKMLKKILKDNNFKVQKITYFNTFLFFPAVMARISEKITKKTTFEKSKLGFLNVLFYKIFYLEKYFLRFCKFPFGVSLMVIAEKV